MTPRDVDASSTVPIEEDGAFATYLTVPGSAELFGTRRAVEVAGTVDGHGSTATRSPSGEGPSTCGSACPDARPGAGHGRLGR